MDPLEKEQLRRRMADRMRIFLEGAPSLSCVSSHYYEESHLCELCQTVHATEVIVVKNRSGKKMLVALPCLKEMVRFRVTDVDDLPRWLEKLVELRTDAEKRRLITEQARLEERRRLEKKVIVRKRVPEGGTP